MTASDAALDPARLDDLVEACQRTLEALSEKGMELVRSLDPNDPAVSIGEAALAFNRLSRSIRLNLMLSLRLDELACGGIAALGAERALNAATMAAAAPPEADAADPVDVDPAEPGGAARERLDREAPDEALRLIRRPMTEVVAAICKGFGLSPEEIETAQAPFAVLTANDDGPDAPPACRTAGVPPARPRSRLKARLMGGSGARPRGP